VARGLLRRTVQAACPDVDLDRLEIRATRAGRPVARPDDLNLYLSVSHTRGLAVAAACPAVPIGVDVEPLDRVGLPPVAAWLAPDERHHLDSLPSEQRRRWLLGRWVAKEGAIKVDGGADGWTRRQLSIVDAHVVHRPEGPDGSAGTRVADVDWHVIDGRFVVAFVVAADQPPSTWPNCLPPRTWKCRCGMACPPRAPTLVTTR
jgi:phosphopantetheinyl transferase (holo-ACP synthase)